MIRRFPYEEALLARTKLRYVNLSNILSDAKVDRSARIPGFVAIYLGTETDLIFLQGGEPVSAARMRPDGRSAVSVADVTERAHIEEERAEIGYYRASPRQVSAMWSTIARPPSLDLGTVSGGARALLALLRDRSFEGVVEVVSDGSVSYGWVREGALTQAFPAGRTAGAAELPPKALEGDVLVRGYTGLDQIPPQASPALFALYERTAASGVGVAAARLGQEAAVECFAAALKRASERHPVLAAFTLTPDGRIRAAPALAASAAAGEVTESVAAWLFDALSHAARAGGADPADLLREVGRDQRFALKAQGFFAKLPWPVAF